MAAEVDDETWRLGALYRYLARVGMSRSNVKVTGDKKKRKSAAFFRESSSGARSCHSQVFCRNSWNNRVG